MTRPGISQNKIRPKIARSGSGRRCAARPRRPRMPRGTAPVSPRIETAHES
ncbi:hypothetical protein BURPS1106A_A1118 [Burkholderia pseudomallei 1106a]|uniref:Uncharacterized protein n=1 Tax=Burkholderia pseudomallei (strain 1106a) TaxID=357348 RepID=A3P493_BURP0|nr:hypothetical protein BURPS1106A_A1118 [Burkholderia pseudomallei 1106a]